MSQPISSWLNPLPLRRMAVLFASSVASCPGQLCPWRFGVEDAFLIYPFIGVGTEVVALGLGEVLR